MRILFVVNIPSPYRVDFFNKLGEKCDLTVAFEGQNATDRSTEWKYGRIETFQPIFMQGIRVRTDRFICKEVISIVKKKWDAIILGGYSSPTTMLAIEYMRIHSIPFYIEVDGGFVKSNSRLKLAFKKHFVSSARGWFSTGKETTEFLKYYGADEKHCYIYPFTSISESDLMDAEELTKKKGEIRAEKGIKEKTVILSVGQFIHRKGLDLLISAAAELDEDTGVYIVGGNPTEEYLTMVKEKHLSNVHFIGFKPKEDLKEYYAAADLFIHPTREDIWGLVVNEAMAFSLPVITTDRCIAGLELVKNEYNGYIVPAGKVKALSDAIKHLLYETNLDELGKHSREIIENYTIEKMAGTHIEVLERFLLNAK